MIGGVFRPQAIYRTPSPLLIKVHRECVSRSTASGSSESAATRTSPTRPGTATTTHASTTGSKLTYTLAGDGSPVTRIDYTIT